MKTKGVHLIGSLRLDHYNARGGRQVMCDGKRNARIKPWRLASTMELRIQIRLTCAHCLAPLPWRGRGALLFSHFIEL